MTEVKYISTPLTVHYPPEPYSGGVAEYSNPNGEVQWAPWVYDPVAVMVLWRNANSKNAWFSTGYLDPLLFHNKARAMRVARRKADRMNRQHWVKLPNERTEDTND